MDSRNKIIVGFVIGLVALVVLGFIFLGPANQCKLVDTEPAKPKYLTELDKVGSRDNKALASFAGYLKYNIDGDEKKVYLPLDLQSINSAQTKGDDKTDFTTFTLNTNCAKVSLQIKLLDYTIKVYQAVAISVDLTTPNGKTSRCTVEYGLQGIQFAPANHYRCLLKKTYECIGGEKKEKVAELVLYNLEFEFDGNADKIKNKEFSTEAENCKV